VSKSRVIAITLLYSTYLTHCIKAMFYTQLVVCQRNSAAMVVA
jgi:hypothetical protein